MLKTYIPDYLAKQIKTVCTQNANANVLKSSNSALQQDRIDMVFPEQQDANKDFFPPPLEYL